MSVLHVLTTGLVLTWNHHYKLQLQLMCDNSHH